MVQGTVALIHRFTLGTDFQGSMHHALTESGVTENLESFILLHVSHGYDSLSP